MKFEEIKEEFDKLVQQIDIFVPINLEATKEKLKRYGEELLTKTSEKQRIDDKDVPAIGEKVAEVKEEEQVKRTGKRNKQKARKGVNVDKSAQEYSETDKEESVEAMNLTPLTTKSDIYISFGATIKDFTREDLIELYRLVMQKYGTNRPEDAYDRVLWSDLRTMFDPPLIEDAIWSLPLQQKMKKNKVEAKAAANAFNADIQVKKVASKRCVGKEGASRKRRKVRLETTLHPNSEHVSSPVPLNYPKPLEALANEEHVSRNTSAGEEKGQDNVDTAFVNEGHGNNEVTATTQANALLRFEALTEEHANLVYAYESCKDMKVRYKESKKELSSLQSALDEKVFAYGRLYKDYDAAERIKQLEAELKQSEIDTHQLCVDREKYVDECGNGEIVRRMIINELLLCAGCIRALSTNGRWERPSALLLAKRYPYVDKVARAYLLDLAGLHNVMPDETSPMSGGD
ncbi:hypothetical protein Tco_0026206 [Tanacetum coccineum]